MTPKQEEILRRLRRALDSIPGTFIREGCDEQKLAYIRTLVEEGEAVADQLEARWRAESGRLQ